MKKISSILFALIAVCSFCLATPENEFSKKIKEAFESGDPEAFIELHYLEGSSDELMPMVRNRWKHALKRAPEAISFEQFGETEKERYNQEMKIKGQTYVRNAPASAFVVIEYSDGNSKVPISLVEGTYYIAWLKPK